MRIVKSLTVALAASALLAGNASAAQQNFPPAKFSTDEAAYCTATFGWVLQFLAPQGMSQEAVVQTNIAFMMWNYEMQVSAPTADDATMQAAADSAVTKLTANFPQEQSEANAKLIVDQVTAAANDCGNKIEAAYPDGNHPVIAELQKKAAEARAAKAAADAAAPAQ
jgi:hypothetical protein